jgi:uncharacterized protein YjdB
LYFPSLNLSIKKFLMKKSLLSLFLLVFALCIGLQSKAAIVQVPVPSPGNVDFVFGFAQMQITIEGQTLSLLQDDYVLGLGFQIEFIDGINGLILPASPVLPLLKKLNAGDVISASSNFASNDYAYHTDESSSGTPLGYCIQNGMSTIFGFKIESFPNTYYGWINVTRNLDFKTTINQIYYENTPNTPIIAGAINYPVTNVSVAGSAGASTITVDNGTLQMNATIVPSNASNPGVTWSVTNGTGMATISPSGLLTAVTNGTVTVTATSVSNPSINGTAVITLSNQVVLITGISITGQGGVTSISTAGGTLQMIANISPTFATNQNITWTIIGGTGFGTINPTTGLLTAIANGTIIVKGTTTDGSSFFANTSITVSNQPPVPVSSIAVSGFGGATAITTNVGTLQMLKNVLPSYATNASVTWSVINGTGSATISPTGLLTAVTDGTVTVVATASDGSGVSGSVVITLSNQIVYVTSVAVVSATGSPNIVVTNGTLQLAATVLPSNATNLNVTWTIINNSGSASIDANGLVTAISNGTVTAIATANDGTGAFGTILLNLTNQLVFTPITSIFVNASSNYVYKNNFLQMYSIITPALATNQNIIWSVINTTGAATINSTGLLAATAVGKVVVIASATDNSNEIGSKEINVIALAPAGLDDINIANISVKPNPFASQIAISNLGAYDFDYVLYNNLGQIIQLGKVNESNHFISLATQPTGNYFLKLSFKSQPIFDFKLMKL